MHEIIKGLYLGSDDDVAKAKARGMSRLAACKDGIDSHRSLLGYESLAAPRNKEYLFAQRGNVMALNLIDSDNPAFVPDKVLDAGLKFIKEQRDAGKTVFVHCNAGRSRSPSIVMLYLRSIGELPQGFKQAEHVFKTIYPDYEPKAGIRTHVRARWNKEAK